MTSKATTVKEYLAALPDDRRAALEGVRSVILKNLDKGFEEGMQYGGIGYFVPHRVYPPGYHCDPKQPLPFAGLASRKGAMSLYLMCVYGSPEEDTWFRETWAKTGKKLDMGKSCIRFKKLEDLALDVIAQVFRRVSAKKYISHYESTFGAKARSRAKPTSKAMAAVAKKSAASSKKPAAKQKLSAKAKLRKK